MTTMRLDRLLSNLGYGSRKDIAYIAKAGRITLRGAPVTKADLSVNLIEASQAMSIDGEALDPLPPLTIMLHKPAGFTCSHNEQGALVYDLLPERWRHRKPALSSVGRLDKESAGQLLLTDDGELLHRVIHPKRHAAKHYRLTLRDALHGGEASLFARGDFLMKGDDKPLKPALWQPLSGNQGNMILQEGRYHQIRRMFETLGNQVVALHRFQTGGLALGELPEGEYRILSPDEIAAIFDQI